jgi:hypothetical protein
MKHLLLLLIFLLISSPLVFSQQGNVKIGAEPNQYRQTQGGFYDYSDPEALNIKVSVWGFVKYPGYYLVPTYTTPKELLSYAGGPTDAAHLDDLRIYRVKEDSTQNMIKFSYNDLLWEPDLKTRKDTAPTLLVNDVLVVPGAPRYYFRDNLTMILSIVSAVTSIAILIVGISRK